LAFNATCTWTGAKRIPNTVMNPLEYRLPEYSQDFITINAQVSFVKYNAWEIYLGIENLTNFRQNAPILAPNDPTGPYFDASLTGGLFLAEWRMLGFG
jgi:outer membrane receptor for ferrienterochelin and colicins